MEGENKFDINSLSEDARKYIDQQINSGVLTGKKNAEEKLKSDPNFISNIEKSIREKIENEAKLSAEEKAKSILDQATQKEKLANLKNNKIEARELFAESGISKDEYSEILDLLVSDDNESTIKNVTKYIEKYNKTVQDRVAKEIEKKLNDTTTPNTKNPNADGNNKDNANKKKVSDYTTQELTKLKIENPEEYKSLFEK